MLKTISFISISIHHVFASYWPYLNGKYESNQYITVPKESGEISDLLLRKIKIIYENSMIGIMIGLSFFHLMPIANHQIILVLHHQQLQILASKTFPYGTLTAILAFVFVLANSNYFYHANSTKKNPKVGNFRNRFQFEHEMLSNKKLKIRRRLAIQSFGTQVMISLPSIMLTSSLVSENETKIWFWCLITILFQKHQVCLTFGRSYYAAGLQRLTAIKLILAHLAITLAYMACGYIIIGLFPIMNGVLNGISCGIIMYDVMIEKLANNYEEKNHLFQKILFFVCGILLSTVIISP